MAARPSVGVVIPCHDNAWQLNGILESLDRQAVRPDMVVVVDDNSSPRQARRLTDLCRRHGARYTRLPSPGDALEALGRRSHSRNAGTRCLDTEVVLYLDGDMLLGPKYIEEIAHYHAVLPRVYIRGQRYSICAELQQQGIEACLSEITKERTSPELSLPYMPGSTEMVGQQAYADACYDRWEWCASNNLSVRREYASQIGYWDEHFVGWGEEDIDFSFRLYRLGLTPLQLVSGNAAAYHLDHHIDHEANILTLRRNGSYLMRKFPELAEYRREAYARYHLNIDDLGHNE